MTETMDILFRPIEVRGTKKLGLFTGSNSKIFANSDMVAFKQDCGWYMDIQGHLKSWKIEGITESEGKVVFYGPWLEIQSLEKDYCPDSSEFQALIHFLSQIDSRKENEFSALHMARLKEGGFIQFPPLLMNEIIKLSRDRADFPLRQFRHPDLKGDRLLSYSLGCIQFRMMTGHYPWIETEQEPMDHEIRERILPHLEKYYQPRKSAELVWGSLQLVEEGPELKEWQDYQVIEEKTCPPLLVEELQKSYKRFYQKRYAMKNRVKLAAIGLAIALAVYISVTVIMNILAPPYTEGLSQREVVELFYESWGSLDVGTADELVIRRSRIDSQQNMDFMFVTSKVRQANDFNTRVLSPEQWLAAGKPNLEPTEILFGITDLELEDEGNNQFSAHYLAWYPPSGDEDPQSPTILEIQDEVYLRQKKDAWFIDRVTTMEKNPVEHPEL